MGWPDSWAGLAGWLGKHLQVECSRVRVESRQVVHRSGSHSLGEGAGKETTSWKFRKLLKYYMIPRPRLMPFHKA